MPLGCYYYFAYTPIVPESGRVPRAGVVVADKSNEKAPFLAPQFVLCALEFPDFLGLFECLPGHRSRHVNASPIQ